MEAATADASLVAAAVPALEAGGRRDRADRSTRKRSLDDAGEIATETLLTSVDGDFVIVPILENDERVACVVVRIVEDDAAARRSPTPTPAARRRRRPRRRTHRRPRSSAPPRSTPSAAVRRTTSAVHEFQPLGDGMAAPGPARPLTLLNDVRHGGHRRARPPPDEGARPRRARSPVRSSSSTAPPAARSTCSSTAR